MKNIVRKVKYDFSFHSIWLLVTVTTNIKSIEVYHPSQILSYKVLKIVVNDERWVVLACEYSSVLLMFSDAPISSIVETLELRGASRK